MHTLKKICNAFLGLGLLLAAAGPDRKSVV